MRQGAKTAAELDPVVHEIDHLTGDRSCQVLGYEREGTFEENIIDRRFVYSAGVNSRIHRTGAVDRGELPCPVPRIHLPYHDFQGCLIEYANS